MKKLYIFFTMLLALTACSSEDIAINTTEEPEVEPIEEVVGIKMKIESPVKLGDENITRSFLAYDDDKNIMDFSWEDEDCIGVFSYPDDKDPNHSSQQRFEQIEDPSNSQYLRTFKTPDGALTVTPNATYIACFPYFADHSTNYTNIPVSYLGQRQKEPVDFSNYWNDENDEAYKASQPKASAHLSDYDYQCTGPTLSRAAGGILFEQKRMGAIVRFWIVIDPDNNYVYDELQLVNRTKQFTTKATMDAYNKTLTPTGQSHVVNLQLGEVDEGFDMTEQELGSNGLPTTPFYDYYNSKYTGYLMLYMMMAPIDLTGDDVENCFIYLVAHEKGKNPESKHYFKSPGLSKPNLEPNTFYQWTVYPEKDTPIEMESITVEEWRTGTSFNNGEDGKGTETW